MHLVIAMRSANPASIWRWPQAATERLRRDFPTVTITEYPGAIDQPPLPADAALFADADAAVAWRLDPALWRAAPRLRWIHCPSAAVHQLLTPELVASDIAVTNGASVHAATVAEHVLALMLALARGLPQAARQQAARRWEAQAMLPSLDTLAGAAALIVGMGHIGRELAPRLAALGMRVSGIRRRAEIGVSGCEAMHPPEALDDLLPAADYVVLALPATAATEARMGAAQFARMRPSAKLVSVGRGASLDENALLAALAAGRPAAAALDVFAREPLPPESPLWSCEKILLTPHIAAATPRTWERQVDLIGTHLRRFLAGQPLAPLVDKQRGY